MTGKCNDANVILRGYHWRQREIENTPEAGIFYLALNMSSVCNYRCSYCFVGLDSLTISGVEMDVAAKVRVMREAKECGARALSMPGRGEPLFDNDFWDVLDEANRLGLYVVVYTNGYFLDKEKIKRLKDSDISLYVKVDSFRPDVYETLVGQEGVFGRIRANLDLLVNEFHCPEKDEGRIVSRLGINSVVTAHNAESIHEIANWCREREIYYTCRSPVKVGEAELNWDSLTQNRVEYLRSVGQQFAARDFTSATERGQCGIYRYGITIENDGEVYVCPDAREGFGRIGNVKETNLQELIRRRNTMFPPDSSPGYCFVKMHRNPEERKTSDEDPKTGNP
jgi:MoaA/NifB/PqqE/SkfB family radical SAM enzyme